MLIAESSAASLMIDVVGKIIVPVLGILVAASAALYAIHRADARERQKRKGDEVLKSALEFFSVGSELEIACKIFVREFDDAEAPSRPKLRNQLIRSFMGFYDRLEFAANRLDLLGEQGLAKVVSDYANGPAERLRSELASSSESGKTSLNTPSRFALIQDVATARRKLSVAFLERTRAIERAWDFGFLSRVLRAFKV